MTNTSNTQIGKRLKRTSFDVFDTAISFVMYLLLQFVILVFFGMFPKEILENQYVLIVLQIAIEAVFLLSVYMTSVIRDVEWVQASGYRAKMDGKVWLYGTIIAVLTLVCFSKLPDLFIYFIQSLGFKYKYNAINVSNFGFFLVALIVHCAVPAITEETLFRGCICGGLKNKNKHLAVFVSAILFTLMHATPLQTIHQFVLGVIYGYIFVYTSNIWISVVAHFLNNGLTITLYYISSIIHKDAMIEDGTIIEFEQVSGKVLAVNIVYAVVLAAIGVVAIVYLIKSLKRHYQKNEQVDTANTNENIDTKTEACDEDKAEKKNLSTNILNDKSKRQKIWIVVLYVLGGILLLKDWIDALILGFLL